MYRLILASESPRRRELLTKAGIAFESFPVKVSEIPEKNLIVKDKILSIANKKFNAAWTALKSRPDLKPFVLLTADTEVIIDDLILGKPKDQESAFAMLRLLSSREHEVVTAFCLGESEQEKKISHIETSRIKFKELSDLQIKNYVQTGEGYDKAGSYAIQGLGGNFVDKLEGSLSNVIGLPVEKVVEILAKENWVIKQNE